MNCWDLKLRVNIAVPAQRTVVVVVIIIIVVVVVVAVVVGSR